MRNTAALRLFFFSALFLTSVLAAQYQNITIDNTDPSIQFSSGWRSCPDDGDAISYNATRNCTTQTDTSASFTFTGVAIYYIAPLFTDSNIITALALDSEPRVLVNLTVGPGQSIEWGVRWGASGLNNGSHTIVLYGPSSDNSTTPSGTWGEVDGFIYTVAEPSSSPSPSPSPKPNDLHTAAIAGGAVGGVVALVLALGAYHIFGLKLVDWLKYIGYFIFGWFFFKGRRFTFISNVPRTTEITLFLTLTPRFPGSTSQAQSSGDAEDRVLCWKVLSIGPGNYQQAVHLPSRGRTGDPGLVFCTLRNTRNVFEAEITSFGATSDFIQNGDSYEWAPNDRTGISVVNKAPHEAVFALATPFDEESADPFWKFTVPPNGSQNFTGKIFVHAFETSGVTPGYQQEFSPEFLANRITEEEGYEVSKLGPNTYWYVQENGDRLKVEIRKSRKGNYKWRRPRATVAVNA